MGKTKRKVQEPAYKVLTPEEEAGETTAMGTPQPQIQSLMGQPPVMSSPTMRPQISENNANMGSAPFSRHNPRDRKMRFKPSTGPTRSLMSIDFGMGVNNPESSAAPKKGIFHGSHSSDEESSSDRRSEWKGTQRNQSFREPADRQRNIKPLDQAVWGPPSHAPLIVDMGRGPSCDIHQNNQAQSLLGDYWASQAKKPAALMDFMPKDKIMRFPAPSAPFPRQDNFFPVPNLQRNIRPVGNRGDSMQRKRTYHLSEASELPEKKIFKHAPSQKPQQDMSNRLKVCKGGGRSFVIIPASCPTTYLHGRAKFTVLIGNVSILAYKLKEGKQYDVLSPTSGSLLALNCADGQKLKAEKVKEKLSNFNVAENDLELKNLGNTTIALVMLEKLESTACDYITTFIPYTQLFTAPMTREKDLHSLKGVTLPKLGLKIAPLKEMGPMCLNMSQDYEDILGRFTTQLSKAVSSNKPPPVWLCCGAKNSGKSTFCRMLINTALQSVNAVGYLECDVGQTEFSPPATISFHVIKKPILGQPFCHQRLAEKMVFYGEISAGHDPSMYMKCLRHVYESYKETEQKLPLIVNTMGFPEGVGLMLMIDTVQLVQPNIVVQIESHNQAANFPAITHEMVALDEGWTTNKSPVLDPKTRMEETHAHELILLPTLLNQRRDFSLKLKPVDLRNLALLSSLSLGLEPGLNLTSLPPYTVPFRELAMHVCHHRLSGRDILTAVNASVVALCTADISQTRRDAVNMPLQFDEMPVCDCLGIAMVRAVDFERGLLYIVSTLPRAKLSQVNTVLKGCIALPDQIILKQKNSGPDPLPYVDALAPSTGVGAVRQRARMPRVTLGGGNNNA